MNNEELTNAFKAANPFKKSRPVKQPTMAKKDLFEEITMSNPNIHEPTKVSTTTSYVERYKNSRLKFAFAFASVSLLLGAGAFTLLNRNPDPSLVAAEPAEKKNIDNGTSDDSKEQETSDDWGPLAVLKPTEGADDALLTGTLVIEEECVYIQSVDERYLLALTLPTVGWNSEINAITISDFNDGAQQRLLRDGDSVNLGGSQLSSNVNYQDLDWVQEPAQTCETDNIWIGHLTPETADTEGTVTEDPNNPATINMESFSNLPLEEAKARAEEAGYETRVVSQDGNNIPIEDDLRQDRINFSTVNGTIIKAEIY